MKQKKDYIHFMRNRSDRGSTLVEMVVCFALLGIFMACAAALISSITSIHYVIKGEMISREVSDIIMEKIVSEIDGAEYFGETGVEAQNNPTISADHLSIELFDRTDTRVKLFKNDHGLDVQYQKITVDGDEDSPESRSQSDWYFDEAVYKGFQLTELYFYSKGSGTITSTIAEKYGLSSTNLSAYPNNVVLVLLKLEYERDNEEYYYFRFVKMYNVPE